MSLKHEFVIINSNTDINELEDGFEKIEIDDNLFLYINDSLKWLVTNWNNNSSEVKGMNYNGYTSIKGNNILKLNSIIDSWISLFLNAPEIFELKGDFLINEDKYEKNLFCKSDTIGQLEDLKAICNKSIAENMVLLHIGV